MVDEPARPRLLSPDCQRHRILVQPPITRQEADVVGSNIPDRGEQRVSVVIARRGYRPRRLYGWKGSRRHVRQIAAEARPDDGDSLHVDITTVLKPSHGGIYVLKGVLTVGKLVWFIPAVPDDLVDFAEASQVGSEHRILMLDQYRNQVVPLRSAAVLFVKENY